MAEAAHRVGEPLFPRITIKFCTQCKWMLRAAYYAQELLSTFSTSLGEVALQPGTGGVFVVEITTTAATITTSSPSDSAQGSNPTAAPGPTSAPATAPAAETAATSPSPTGPTADATCTAVLWDRKRDGGFPETKELKRRVRDVIQPGRDLGHVDRDYPAGRGREGEQGPQAQQGQRNEQGRSGAKEEGGGDKHSAGSGGVGVPAASGAATAASASGKQTVKTAEGDDGREGKACGLGEQGGGRCEDCE